MSSVRISPQLPSLFGATSSPADSPRELQRRHISFPLDSQTATESVRREDEVSIRTTGAEGWRVGDSEASQSIGQSTLNKWNGTTPRFAWNGEKEWEERSIQQNESEWDDRSSSVQHGWDDHSIHHSTIPPYETLVQIKPAKRVTLSPPKGPVRMTKNLKTAPPLAMRKSCPKEYTDENSCFSVKTEFSRNLCECRDFKGGADLVWGYLKPVVAGAVGCCSGGKDRKLQKYNECTCHRLTADADNLSENGYFDDVDNADVSLKSYRSRQRCPHHPRWREPQDIRWIANRYDTVHRRMPGLIHRHYRDAYPMMHSAAAPTVIPPRVSFRPAPNECGENCLA